MDELAFVELLTELVWDGEAEVSFEIPDEVLERLVNGTALDLWRLVVGLRTRAEPLMPRPASGDAVWLRVRVALAAVLGAAPDDIELDTPLGGASGGPTYGPGAAARLDSLTWQMEMLGGDDDEARDRALESLTLEDLAAWEDRVMARVAAATGDPEERDRALEGARVYADYPRICEGYLVRTWSPRDGAVADRREALRRLVYLVWCSGARPAFLTGVAELPDEIFQAAVSALEAQCERGALDAELRWMLGWYHAATPEVFGRFHDHRALQRFLAATSADDWRRAAPRPDDFRGRGQMGRYWEAVVRKG